MALRLGENRPINGTSINKQDCCQVQALIFTLCRVKCVSFVRNEGGPCISVSSRAAPPNDNDRNYYVKKYQLAVYELSAATERDL